MTQSRPNSCHERYHEKNEIFENVSDFISISIQTASSNFLDRAFSKIAI